MIDDNTEIQISLKTIISVIVAVVAMTSVVVRYEIKVDSLLAKIGKLEIHIQNTIGKLMRHEGIHRLVRLTERCE